MPPARWTKPHSRSTVSDWNQWCVGGGGGGACRLENRVSRTLIPVNVKQANQAKPHNPEIA